MVVRAILDTGASLNIITNRVVQFLGLDCAPQNMVIAGAYGDLVSKRSTTMQLTSMHEVDDTDYLEATCHVVHQLVSAPHCLEAVAVRKDPWTKRLQPLADSSFGKGGSVDLLLDSKNFSEASVEQISKHPTGTFTALNTIFRWVVFGGTTSPTNSAVALRADVKLSLDTLLSKLWEREEVPEIRDCYPLNAPSRGGGSWSHSRKPSRNILPLAMLRKSLQSNWRSHVSNTTIFLCMWSSRLPLLPPKPDQSLMPLPRPPQGGH